MQNRYLTPLIEEFCFPHHKMAFISGPRQCGKTTLAKTILSQRKCGQYFNWDDKEFKKKWAQNPRFILPNKSSIVPIVILDEIHKAKFWKRSLKGVFDTMEAPADIIVTGSARLNIYKKGGDSLLGRYYSFRLHPFTLAELVHNKPMHPEKILSFLFSRTMTPQKNQQDVLESILKLGGFPEPFLSQNERQANVWRASRTEKVIREDLRDLSRLPDLAQIETLAAILPDKVGGLFSLSSLREDLETSHNTIKRWLTYLKELYYIFEIKPYQLSIVRSLKKEGKMYLWDHSEVNDPGARFENLVACHLLKACHFWTDSGEGAFDLFFLRNKEKEEVDFLITKNKRPWLPIEVKLSDTTPASSLRRFLRYLPCKKALQLVAEPHAWQTHTDGETQILVASASEALSYFV
ncbi:MAG: hypothetical protein KCHDKBKB_02084 [Elusimicrobia bacterium]|nr:hypothetical protein [Elusimicrobiota bacterium]